MVEIVYLAAVLLPIVHFTGGFGLTCSSRRDGHKQLLKPDKPDKPPSLRMGKETVLPLRTEGNALSDFGSKPPSRTKQGFRRGHR
jgi:hypothetical protein